jgi:hypothetical protein
VSETCRVSFENKIEKLVHLDSFMTLREREDFGTGKKTR